MWPKLSLVPSLENPDLQGDFQKWCRLQGQYHHVRNCHIHCKMPNIPSSWPLNARGVPMIVAITKEPLGTVAQLWEERCGVDKEETDGTVQG